MQSFIYYHIATRARLSLSSPIFPSTDQLKMGSTDPLNIAVLINSPPENIEFWSDVRQAWKEAFALVSPTANVDLYDPVVERKFPDATKYHLIALSGGKADASCSEPWVLGVLNYVQDTVRNSPQTKILGVCWGHQAVSRALGGEVRAVPTGPIVSICSISTIFHLALTRIMQAAIEEIHLTEAGKKFFPFAATSGFYVIISDCPKIILVFLY